MQHVVVASEFEFVRSAHMSTREHPSISMRVWWPCVMHYQASFLWLSCECRREADGAAGARQSQEQDVSDHGRILESHWNGAGHVLGECMVWETGAKHAQRLLT